MKMMWLWSLHPRGSCRDATPRLPKAEREALAGRLWDVRMRRGFERWAQRKAWELWVLPDYGKIATLWRMYCDSMNDRRPGFLRRCLKSPK
jgi:hypothetical protein